MTPIKKVKPVKKKRGIPSPEIPTPKSDAELGDEMVKHTPVRQGEQAAQAKGLPTRFLITVAHDSLARTFGEIYPGVSGQAREFTDDMAHIVIRHMLYGIPKGALKAKLREHEFSPTYCREHG